jgi:predicted nucleic acid-binding protein
MIVADTDVLIDFLEGAEPGARRIGLELEHQALVTTVITCFELLAGARSDRQRHLITELLSALRCLPLDEVAADRAAAVRQTLVAGGIDIGMATA